MKIKFICLLTLSLIAHLPAFAQPALSKDPKVPIVLDIVAIPQNSPGLLINKLPIDKSELPDVLTDWEIDFGKDHFVVIMFDSEVPLSEVWELRDIFLKSAYKKMRIFYKVKTSEGKKALRELPLDGSLIPIPPTGVEISKLVEQKKS